MEAEFLQGARSPGSKTVLVVVSLLAGLLLVESMVTAGFIKKFDAKYRQLVLQTTANLNQIDDIALRAGLAHARALQLPFTREVQKREELITAITRTRSANDRVFEQLNRDLTDPALRSALKELVSRRQVFREATEAFVTGHQTAAAPETATPRSQELLQSFIEYQESCGRLIDRIGAQSVRLSEQSSEEIRRLRLLLLGVGLLPIGLAAALVLITVYLVRFTSAEADLR